jgi:type 1 glutamine amidotransferase
VKPFKLTEEFYFHLRFRENDPRLSPVLFHSAETNAESTVGWAVERANGGRGFGFTGGHFFKNWWLPDFRRLVLNAIAWTAHMEVPEEGIRSQLDGRRNVLVVTGANHPAHDWRSTTAALLFALEQDPRLNVDVTENPNDLASVRWPGQALVVLNYCNWQTAGLSEAARTNFTRYLSNGGGVAVVHFANGAFHASLPGAPASDWPEYRRIVRRVWDHQGGSGHDAYGPFRVVTTAATHDITRGMPPFEALDELYFKQAGEEPIVPLAVAVSKSTGHEEPMAWAHAYGEGRVFQTVLGHSAESIRRAATLMRRGSAWAAGLSPLGFDPPPECLEGATFRNGSKWKPDR